MNEVKDFNIKDWGGYAKCYDALNLLRPYQQLQKTVIAKLDLSPGQVILDAATGTGNLAWWIKKGGGLNGARIIGIDFSEEMLGEAEEKNVEIDIRLIKSDLNQRLTFDDCAFNQIVSVNTLYALASPENFLAELFRVLKPGGKLILVNPKKGYQNGLVLKNHCGDTGPDESWLGVHESSERERDVIFRAIKEPEAIAKLVAIAEFNRKISATRKFHFLNLSELFSLLRKAGFFDFKFEEAYADQGLLAVGRKRSDHENA